MLARVQQLHIGERTVGTCSQWLPLTYPNTRRASALWAFGFEGGSAQMCHSLHQGNSLGRQSDLLHVWAALSMTDSFKVAPFVVSTLQQAPVVWGVSLVCLTTNCMLCFLIACLLPLSNVGCARLCWRLNTPALISADSPLPPPPHTHTHHTAFFFF